MLSELAVFSALDSATGRCRAAAGTGIDHSPAAGRTLVAHSLVVTDRLAVRSPAAKNLTVHTPAVRSPAAVESPAARTPASPFVVPSGCARPRAGEPSRPPQR